MKTAKIFMNGHSQAVRLPKAFNLHTKSVSIFRLGNAIVLQPIQESWMDVYKEMYTLESFMDDYKDIPPQERESF